MTDDTLTPLFRELEVVFEPVVDAAQTPEGVSALLQDVGWELPPGDPGTAALVDGIVAAARTVDVVAQFAEHPPERLDELLDALRAVAATAEALERLVSGLPPGGPDSLARLPLELLEALTLTYLHRRAPVAYDILYLLGVIDTELRRGVEHDGVELREAHLAHTLRTDRLEGLLTDPAKELKELYLPLPLATQAEVEGFCEVLFSRLAALLEHLGAEVLIGRGGSTGAGLTEDEARALDSMLTAAWSPATPAGPTSTGATLRVLPADAGRAGLYVAPFGGVELTRAVGRWLVELRAMADLPGFLIARDGVEFLPPEAGAPADVDLGVKFSRIGSADGGIVIGAPQGTRLELARLVLAAGARLRTDGYEIDLDFDLSPAALVIAAGDGDGFLQTVLPDEGIRVPFALALGWSSSRGLRFGGSAGLQFTAQLDAAIGPVVVESVSVALNVDADALTLGAGVAARLELGPFVAVVSGLGIEFEIAFGRVGNLGNADLALRFQPPDSVGLAIKSEMVSGGGFLRLDPDAGQYDGVFELTIAETISVKVIGLISTKLPDGRPGFALLIIITADGFTPIQLGMGFTLTGIGGLLALNRTLEIDAVRGGLKNGVLDSVLFPKDPVKNAGRVISTLNSVFPQAPDRLVVGPMATIAWSSPPIVTVRLAVLLELPDPLRIIVLASLSALLPSEKNPVLQLRVDAVGVLDFKRGELSFDASLFDSRLWKFGLTGDLAVRLRWKEEPQFVLSVGGFHPRYAAPPGVPKMERLALTLTESDNPRLRFDCYFALTSNSIQFGAHVELFAAALGFELKGAGGFDALIQWSPFLFSVDVYARLGVRFAGAMIMSINLELGLIGPDPWRAHGIAEVQFLLLKAQVSFELQLGEGRAPEPPEEIDAGGLLWEAMIDVGSWAAALPADQQPGVTLNAWAAEGLLAHPLATVTVRQRVLPLDTLVTRMGVHVPKGGAAVYHVDVREIEATTAGLEVEPVSSPFALGQFQERTEDQRLTDPDFVDRIAGYAVSTGRQARYPKTGALDSRLSFETRIFSELDQPPSNGAPSSGLAGAIGLAPVEVAPFAGRGGGGSGVLVG